MKVCARCKKSNPDDAKYCIRCGNHLSEANTLKPVSKIAWVKKIPVLGWILIGVVVLAAGLIFIIGSFWAVATVPGVASVIFLIAGFFLFGVYRRGNFTGNKIFRAVAIGFFALMGACVDQTGNQVYNAPLGVIACPAGTSLGRFANVDHPYAGSTIITQDFSCYTATGDRVKTIDMFAIMGIRFAEYIVIAYLLIMLRWLVNRIRKRQQLS